jgi:ABC-type ATPase with predicted acetyltransferase domain
MILLALQIETAREQSTPTRAGCEIARRFGLDLESANQPRRRLSVPFTRGRVTLLKGASGSGKTTVLLSAIAHARAAGVSVIDVGGQRLTNRVCVQQFRGCSVEEGARLLTRAGLADPHVMARRANELSTGEQARLRIAKAMRHAERSSNDCLLVCDDFACDLDSRTAASVGALLARFVERSGAPAIVATTREDITEAVNPANTAQLGPAVVSIDTDLPRTPWRLPFVIERRAQKQRWTDLAWAHHLPDRCASVVERIAAVCSESNETLGVLIVAMPTLNARWRSIGFPDRFDGGSRRRDAALINRDLRRIARVVVDPRVRSLGVATGLVTAYLDAPLTPCTEALASMGRFSGFFERGGMRATALPPSPADARLLDLLAHAGVEPWRLATPASALVRVRRAVGDALLERELRTWAVGARAGAASRDLESTFRDACRALGGEVVAYTHTAQEGEAQ